jgi:hypothetical protein
LERLYVLPVKHPGLPELLGPDLPAAGILAHALFAYAEQAGGLFRG